ncbi:hypothetical protein PENTCL1PPCAC_17657, partial [Pristionchus entomophagus]
LSFLSSLLISHGHSSSSTMIMNTYNIQRPFPHSNEPVISSSSDGSLILDNDSSIASLSGLSLSSGVSSVVSLDTKYQHQMKDVVAQYKDDPALVRDLLCAYESLREQSSKKSRGKSIGGFSRSQLNFIAIVAAACALATYAVALMNRDTFCKKL